MLCVCLTLTSPVRRVFTGVHLWSQARSQAQAHRPGRRVSVPLALPSWRLGVEAPEPLGVPLSSTPAAVWAAGWCPPFPLPQAEQQSQTRGHSPPEPPEHFLSARCALGLLTYTICQEPPRLQTCPGGLGVPMSIIQRWTRAARARLTQEPQLVRGTK